MRYNAFREKKKRAEKQPARRVMSNNCFTPPAIHGRNACAGSAAVVTKLQKALPPPSAQSWIFTLPYSMPKGLFWYTVFSPER